MTTLMVLTWFHDNGFMTGRIEFLAFGINAGDSFNIQKTLKLSQDQIDPFGPGRPFP